MSARAHLDALLGAYVPESEQEQAALDRMRQLLERAAAPFDRHSYVPGHFTASALVRSPEGERVLLIHHSKLGRWLQPGGHIDASDPDVLAAAMRELVEESGVEDPRPLLPTLLDIDIHVIPESARGPAHEHFDLRFAFEVATQELCAGSDALAARWTPYATVTRDSSDESVARAVAKLARLPR